MSELLERILLKITRAKQHIADFQRGCDAFYHSDAYLFQAHEDPRAGERTYKVRRIDPVPYLLTLIAADALHNLRSPLDQICNQLVSAAGGPSKGRCNYPIRDTAAYYQSARDAMAQHLGQPVIDAIDATEPYKGGKGHRLWQLNALNNAEKHVLPLLAACLSPVVDMTPEARAALANAGVQKELIDGLPTPVWVKRNARIVPMKVGDVLFREPLHREKQEDRQFPFVVALDVPGIIEPEPALKTLHDTANLVADVVTRLGRFLP